MNSLHIFGFTFHRDKQVDLDTADMSMFRRIALLEPSVLRCIYCGGCSATCTAAGLTNVNFRRVSLAIRRGQFSEVQSMVARCMLCGKCTMVCPRDVNIRHIMFILKKEHSSL